MPMISDRQRRAIAINGDSIACRLTDNRAPSFGAQQMMSEQPDAITEQHRLVGPASGEPLPDGRVGVRVRIPLSGCPSRRWSRDLSARLANELVGHPAVGHLRLNDLVRGDQLVLEGVEEREAPLLSDALARAVRATNAKCPADREPARNVTQPHADAIASAIAVR